MYYCASSWQTLTCNAASSSVIFWRAFAGPNQRIHRVSHGVRGHQQLDFREEFRLIGGAFFAPTAGFAHAVDQRRGLPVFFPFGNRSLGNPAQPGNLRHATPADALGLGSQVNKEERWLFALLLRHQIPFFCQ